MRERLGQEHRDPGDAAVDEAAGLQESVQAHPRREDSRNDENARRVAHVVAISWGREYWVEHRLATFSIGRLPGKARAKRYPEHSYRRCGLDRVASAFSRGSINQRELLAICGKP